VGLLGRGTSPSQGRYLHTEQHEHRINAHKHLCLKWDSNPGSQCLSGEDSLCLWPRGHRDRHASSTGLAKKQHTALQPKNIGQPWKLGISALAPCSPIFRVAAWFRTLTRRQTLNMNHASYLASNCRLQFCITRRQREAPSDAQHCMWTLYSRKTKYQMQGMPHALKRCCSRNCSYLWSSKVHYQNLRFCKF
jgi:hypothetical protein